MLVGVKLGAFGVKAWGRKLAELGADFDAFRDEASGSKHVSIREQASNHLTKTFKQNMNCLQSLVDANPVHRR